MSELILTATDQRSKVEEITQRLEQGIADLFDSERFKEYLRVMSRFHAYSMNNVLLIAIQRPDAERVAGYNTWKQLGRFVRAGEKGIKILAPIVKKREVKLEVDATDGKTETARDEEYYIAGFRIVSVFDVSQTEGRELPTIATRLDGSVEQYEDFFAALEKTSPVPIAFEAIPSGAFGYYNLVEKRIAVLENMSQVQTIKTTIHEIAHAILHDVDLDALKSEQTNRPDQNTREVEAESVAYVVCQRYGLDTAEYSFGYIAGWSSGREAAELKGSLETIRATAAKIIESIDKYFEKLRQEREADQTAVYRLDGGDYLYIQTCDDGYAYTFYDADFEEIDGGQFDDPDIGISAARDKILALHDRADTKVETMAVKAFEQAQKQGDEPLSPDKFATEKKIITPRGSFPLSTMTREQMVAAGYGFHHQTEDGKHLVMSNGTDAFAIVAEPHQKKFEKHAREEMTR